MAAIHDLKPAAYKWLMDNDPSTWACHTFDHFFKTDHVTINIAESWNEVLNEYRRKPVIDLLEYIRMKLMKRLIRRREKAANWDSNSPPRVHKKLVKIAKSSRNLWVVKASKDHYQVLEDDALDKERSCVVDLKQFECECEGWQISGLPCKHAMACIIQNNLEPVDVPKLLPPVKHVKVGRPKVNRRKEANEGLKKKKR
ncbi:hypothetical protein AB3S75_023055 [Citrus x aurantiifolia]